MVKGTLSISIMVNGRFRVIHTVWVPGASLEEIRKAAATEINEFQRRNEKLDIYSSSVQILLWI